MKKVTNIILAGLGGQGVLRATDILAAVALESGYDVKKSEIKGMSQRGGSVTSDVRFGDRVLSPMVPTGEADFLLVLEATQVEPHQHLLRSGGVLIVPGAVDATQLANKKALNVALLGVLSAHLPFREEVWLNALRTTFDESSFAANSAAFLIGHSKPPSGRTGLQNPDVMNLLEGTKTSRL